VSWLTWWRNLWHGLRGEPRSRVVRSSSGELTEDYESPPPLSLATPGGALRVGVVTTRGNVRRRNEDNYFVSPSRAMPANGTRSGRDGAGTAGGGVAPGREDTDTSRGGPGGAAGAGAEGVPPSLFIVADGMGGQLAGEKASAMAVELIPRELKRLEDQLPAPPDERAYQRAIREAIARANQEILAQSHLQADYANMGTTVGLALFRDGRVFVAGIGDSRVYHIRGDRIEQLTRDHSLAHALEEAGTISPEEVETHKFKNILYLYLGSKDVGEGPEDIRIVEARPGDLFVLATDGLTGVVSDQVISQVVRATDDPQRAAQQLVHRALENQSKDNVTVIVIRVA
jgi:serine/threonine protein phosphatase PrpC